MYMILYIWKASNMVDNIKYQSSKSSSSKLIVKLKFVAHKQLPKILMHLLL